MPALFRGAKQSTRPFSITLYCPIFFLLSLTLILEIFIIHSILSLTDCIEQLTMTSSFELKILEHQVNDDRFRKICYYRSLFCIFAQYSCRPFRQVLLSLSVFQANEGIFKLQHPLVNQLSMVCFVYRSWLRMWTTYHVLLQVKWVSIYLYKSVRYTCSENG